MEEDKITIYSTQIHVRDDKEARRLIKALRVLSEIAPENSKFGIDRSPKHEGRGKDKKTYVPVSYNPKQKEVAKLIKSITDFLGTKADYFVVKVPKKFVGLFEPFSEK
ncbi:MAG: hypothetical protein ACE5J0_01215 [Candidatus Paceibacterales bacterium]